MRALVLFLPQAKLTLASVGALPRKKYNIGTLQNKYIMYEQHLCLVLLPFFLVFSVVRNIG